MMTVSLQVWPWMRHHHPAVHRISGRIAIFAGVLPAGLLALAIMPFSGGPAGNTVAAILWLATTITGFRMARKNRYAEHRRFMIYSFALTMQGIWGRIMFLVIPLFPGYDADAAKMTLEAATWVGFVINLLAAQWWLERTASNHPTTGVGHFPHRKG
jgi:cobalamin biosynthesis protein CobD/CbiB